MFSGNSHDRRKQRRANQRLWENSTPRFLPGEEVRITSACYGQRYEGTKATVIGKGKGYGTYVVQSNRRKSPLNVHQDHLTVEVAKAA